MVIESVIYMDDNKEKISKLDKKIKQLQAQKIINC
ncbi:hypothetical protein CNEO_60079 [Clostridium neonatale]|uniref:Uncharacterized protein n=1 Tax=Clostridium neonatale TaxID=137838 RepID=A0AA86MM37_9CLOT|nr:hypothetical protein CNEO_60079 [Clostridium neonatale]